MARFLEIHTIFKYILLISIIKFVNSYERNEIEVTVSILEKLKTSHCVFVIDSTHFVKLNPREIYNNLFIAHISAERLKMFFDSVEISHLRIGIVIKLDFVYVLKDLFKEVSIL